MRERLRQVDANLLLALQALLEERNLTHAGERMTMSQPAMSGALARLRRHFDDELLVRVGRGFELTPLATRLRPAVAEAIGAAQTLLGEQRGFDPSSRTRRFAVSMSEYAMTVLAEPLLRRLTLEAPTCPVELDPIDLGPGEWEERLLRRDLVFGPAGFGLAGHSQPVFTDRLVCMVARDNPRLVQGALTVADLREMDHAVARLGPAGDIARPLDLALERAGVDDRSVKVLVTNLLTLPFAVGGTGLCAFVPARLARRCTDVLDLVVAQTPLEPIPIVEAAHWHPRRDSDPAVVWLRRLLHQVAVEVEDQDVA